MRTWQEFSENIFDAPGEGDSEGKLFRKGEAPRLPISAKIRPKVTIPGQVTPPQYKDIANKHGHKDHPETTVDFYPNYKHRHINGLTAMVKISNGVANLILSYGGKGSEPIEFFRQNWEAIQSPQVN